MIAAMQGRYTDAAKTIYNRIVDWYVNSYWEDRTDLDWITRFVNEFQEPSKLCDMASGPGNFSQYLRPSFHEVVCIDISERMILAAKQRLPAVTGIVADMRNVPVSDSYFDGILCAYSLNHILREEVNVVLAEFRRIIKTGGIFYVTLKEGTGRYEFSSRTLPDVKSIMELWSADELQKKIEKYRFSVCGVDHKTESNPHEFQHNKLLICCKAI